MTTDQLAEHPEPDKATDEDEHAATQDPGEAEGGSSRAWRKAE